MPTALYRITQNLNSLMISDSGRILSIIWSLARLYTIKEPTNHCQTEIFVSIGGEGSVAQVSLFCPFMIQRADYINALLKSNSLKELI